jgi:hypothetical protein
MTDKKWILYFYLHLFSIDPWVRVTSPNTEYRILDGRYELPVFKNVEVIHGKQTCGDFEE